MTQPTVDRVDLALLFCTRSLRLFAYGLISIVLVLYLKEVGLSGGRVGLLLALTLLGDLAISLWVTSVADRVGRKRMLIVSGALMALGGAAFAMTDDFLPLLLAATIGVISPSGNEVGPFMPIEQAALAQFLTSQQRTTAFAWYHLAGSFATALGALTAGATLRLLQANGASPIDTYRPLFIAYAAIGLLLTILFMGLSRRVEVVPPRRDVSPNPSPTRFGLHRSQRTVMKLSGLFALDAFGGGFVLQSVVAYYLHARFDVDPILLGGLFFGANVLAGVSGLVAAALAKRVGLLNTMVFTHVPANVLLMLVPFMPTLQWAAIVLLARFLVAQMDVPARQSYTAAVVHPDERSAAAGVTGVARSAGAAVAPLVAGLLPATNVTLLGIPFVLAGLFKLTYDLLLYRAFAATMLTDDHPAVPTRPSTATPAATVQP